MRKTIVIIEDDKRNHKLFVDVLRLIPNVDIHSDYSGETGFELVKSLNPDIIILDIQLPVMSGTEICTELRKIDRFQEIPILAVTAFAMKGDKERILNAGFSEYISKPIKVAQFREVVKRYLFSE